MVVSAAAMLDLSVIFNTTDKFARYFNLSFCNSSSDFSTSSVTDASLMIYSATRFEENPSAFKRSSAHNLADFSIDTGNRCSTFGRVKDGINSDITSTFSTSNSIGAMV